MLPEGMNRGRYMSKDFHLAEYGALRAEVLELIKEIEVLNRFFLVSVAVSVAWLLNESGKLDRITSFIGAWMPYFVAQWFSAYRRDLSRAIGRLGDYLLKLEQTYALPELGWQKLLSQQRNALFGRAGMVNRLVALATLIFAFYYAVRFSLNLHVGTLF